MQVLLLSAYDSDSHRRWRYGLEAALPEHAFSVRALPARHYAWRAQGNALAFAEQAPTGPFDLLLACASSDVLSLKGLRPELAAVPHLLYFHDNEFAFPPNPREQGRVERQLRQLLNAWGARRVLFNSNFNRDSFLAGARALCSRLPDGVPGDLVDRIERRTLVLPVPLEDTVATEPGAAGSPGERLQILWNHRWEWDKGPDRLPLLVQALRERRLDFRLHVVGPGFRQRPSAFDDLERLRLAHPECFGAWGFEADLNRYRALLVEADVAIATALHEFQGLALMEAAAAGCEVLAPARQAYPDWLPAACLYPSTPDDARTEASALADALQGLAARRGRARVDLSQLAWRAQRPAWQALLAAAVAQDDDSLN